MKKILTVIIVSFFYLTASSQVLSDSSLSRAYSSTGMRDTKKKFEQFEFKADNNVVYNSDSLLGKITFISFWMESCLPCIAEFEALESLFKKYKGNDKFRFLSFTTENYTEISKIKNTYVFTYPAISIGRVEMSPYNFKMGFPTIAITDEEANVRYLKTGGSTNKKEAEKTVFNLYYQEIDRLLEKYSQN